MGNRLSTKRKLDQMNETDETEEANKQLAIALEALKNEVHRNKQIHDKLMNNIDVLISGLEPVPSKNLFG